MLLEVNGAPVTLARVTFPVERRWWARVAFGEGSVPTGKVTLVADGLELVGTVVASRAGIWRNAPSALIAGGAGGLGKLLEARGYQEGITAGHIATDLLSEAGEALSSSSDAALLARVFAHWSRLRGSCARGLDRLAEALGASWWVDDAGAVVVGVRSWPAASWSADLLELAPTSALGVYVAETAALRPGTTLDGRRVGLVSYTFETRMRAEVEYSS